MRPRLPSGNGSPNTAPQRQPARHALDGYLGALSAFAVDQIIAFHRLAGYYSGVLLRRRGMWLGAAALCVAGAVTAAALLTGGSSAGGESRRNQRWRHDIAYLARRLPQVHVNGVVTGVSGRVWFAAAARLEGRVPRLTDGQVILGVMRLVALLHDDETVVNDADGRPFYLQGPRFPLGLQWIGSHLYVIAVAAGHRALLGSQLVAVSGLPVSRVLELLRPEIDYNNPGVLAFWETQGLTSADLLAWLGVTHSPHAATYTLRATTGKQVKVRLIASRALNVPGPVVTRRATYAGHVLRVTYDSLDGLILTANGSATLAHVPLPMYQTNLATPYWMKVLAAQRAVYLRYNHCIMTDGFQRLAKRALTLLHRHPAFRLIIDLRDNPGGDTSPFQPLLRGIRADPAINRPGRIIGLVNQLSASSATYDAYELTSQTQAVLIGQPPEDPVDNYGNSDYRFRLRGSGIVITYSTKAFDPQKIKMGVPDIYVAPTIRQVLAGQDPVLRTAFEFRREGPNHERVTPGAPRSR